MQVRVEPGGCLHLLRVATELGPEVEEVYHLVAAEQIAVEQTAAEQTAAEDAALLTQKCIMGCSVCGMLLYGIVAATYLALQTLHHIFVATNLLRANSHQVVCFLLIPNTFVRAQSMDRGRWS